MKKIDIETLLQQLDGDLPGPVNDTTLSPSTDRIKTLALSKLSRQLDSSPAYTERSRPMKRKIHLLVAAAVLVALTSVTVFAAAGGLDYFRSIFGNSADTASSQIETPLLNVANADYQLTVEASLTDGYQSNLVLSVTPLGSKKVPAPEQLSGMLVEAVLPEGIPGTSCSLEALDALTTGKKSFYRMKITSSEPHSSQPITLVLSDELGGGTLSLSLQSVLGTRLLTLEPAVSVTDNYSIQSIQLSPLGALIIGSEQQAKGGLPSPTILVKLRDGSTNEIMPDWAFDQSDSEGTTIGGGGAVVGASGGNGPFVSQTAGRRNPDGQIITESSFSQLLPVDDVVAVIIGGTEYPLN